MASFGGSLARALGGQMARKRELEEKEKYEERLAQRELEQFKRKEEIRLAMQANQPFGSPTTTPQGQVVGLVHGKPGESPSLQTYGEIPGMREAYERQVTYDMQRQALTLEKDRSAILKNQAQADKYSRQASGSGGGNRGGLTADQAREAEKDFIKEAFQNVGIYKSSKDNRYYKDVVDKSGKTVPQIVSPLELAEVTEVARSRFRGEIDDSDTNESPYPEGTRLRGPDGVYVVRNGIPVKE